MSKCQCGLCLSCGTPFLPTARELAMFGRVGNQSILYLNAECEINRELLQKYEKPVYSSAMHGAHVFHKSHHATAIDYMCDHHTGDESLAWPAANAVIPAQNGPLAFEKTPTGNANKGASLAVWNAPPAGERLAYTNLLNHIVAVALIPALADRDAMWRGGLDERYDTCTSCNAIMTQQSNMAYTLGYTTTGHQNPHGCAIVRQPIHIRAANVRGQGLSNAYGRWTQQAGSLIVNHPTLDASDSAAPHVAYYLHMCLPLINPANPDPFNILGAGRAARRLYIELCWLVLEIASLANLIEEGKRYSVGGKLSHGLHQHLGALDFYVSYFLWRLCYFEFMHTRGLRDLDFIQWHQKYYWDAVNCPALFPRGTDLIGSMVYANTSINARVLLKDIADGLMVLYSRQLQPLIQFIVLEGVARAALPLGVSSYFLPLAALRELKRRERRQVFIFFDISGVKSRF
jgi:hypothetical protein